MNEETDKYLLTECRARWISVKEAVPAVNRRVLVCLRNHSVLEAFFRTETGKFEKLCRLRKQRYIPLRTVEYWRLEPSHPDAVPNPEAYIRVIKQ